MHRQQNIKTVNLVNSLSHIFINVFLNYPFFLIRRNYFPGCHNQTFFLQRSEYDLTGRIATTHIANGYNRKRKTYLYFGWSRTRDCSEEIITISAGLKTSGHLDRQTSLKHLKKKKTVLFLRWRWLVQCCFRTVASTGFVYCFLVASLFIRAFLVRIASAVTDYTS